MVRDASVEREERECALPRNSSAPEPEPEPEPEPQQWRAKYRGISNSSMVPRSELEAARYLRGYGSARR